MPIPASFAEYVAQCPTYTERQAHVICNRMGVDQRHAEDIAAHINLQLLAKRTVESYKNDQEWMIGKPERDLERLFYTYLNLCMWRSALGWSVKFNSGYLWHKHKTDQASGDTHYKTRNLDAMNYVSETPDHDSSFNGGWDTLPAIQEFSEKRYKKEIRSRAVQDDVAHLRNYMKLKGTRAKVMQVFDLMCAGMEPKEIAEKLHTTHQGIRYMVTTIKRHAAKYRGGGIKKT